MGFNGNSDNNGNSIETGAVNSYIPKHMAFIAFSNDTNLGRFLFGAFISIRLFDILVLNIMPRWGWKGTSPMRLGR